MFVAEPYICRSSPPIFSRWFDLTMVRMFLKSQFVCHQPFGNPDWPKPVAPVMVMPGISRCSGVSGRPTRRMTPPRNSFNIEVLNVRV